MTNINLVIILLILLFSSGIILVYFRSGVIKLEFAIILSFMCILSSVIYTNFFNFFQIYPKDYIYKLQRGDQPLKTYTHWHEIYHYYLGAKYFPELGYNGLYEAVLLADSKSVKPMITKNFLRSLREPTYPITREEGLKRAKEEFLPKFTTERWAEFKGDLEQMKEFAADDWLDLGMFDAGYNPPPTWAVLGYNISNLISINQSEAFFDLRPSWYQMEFLPLIDLAMLLILCLLIFRYFGFVYFSCFVLLFTTSYVAGMGWISGSLLRYTWFFALSLGILFLLKERFLLAGCFLALSTMDRIFPIVFAVSAGLGLIAKFLMNRNNENYKNIVNYTKAFLITAIIMFSISVMQFGFDSWKSFFTKIEAHNKMFFVHHIGYKRLAVFDAKTTPAQSFWWEDGLDRFRNWNDVLNKKWQDNKNYHYMIFAVLIISIICSFSVISIAEFCLLLGGFLLYFLAIPANYYYIYFPIISLVLLASNKNIYSYIILASIFVLWGYLQYCPNFSNDELINNYYICLGFFTFFVTWIFTRLLQSYLFYKTSLDLPKTGTYSNLL
jgi:hypothetical protein